MSLPYFVLALPGHSHPRALALALPSAWDPPFPHISPVSFFNLPFEILNSPSSLKRRSLTTLSEVAMLSLLSRAQTCAHTRRRRPYPSPFQSQHLVQGAA